MFDIEPTLKSKKTEIAILEGQKGGRDVYIGMCFDLGFLFYSIRTILKTHSKSECSTVKKIEDGVDFRYFFAI